MKKQTIFLILLSAGIVFGFSCFQKGVTSIAPVDGNKSYVLFVEEQLNDFEKEVVMGLKKVETDSIHSLDQGLVLIHQLRNKMKGIDPFLRYAEPLAHKAINGPLPVEWETEVFEKFEQPYKRVGKGFTQAELNLDETNVKEVLLDELTAVKQALAKYHSDSIAQVAQTPAHFQFVNRLFLLNCAAIYTTGYECPDTSRILPELKLTVDGMAKAYRVYNASFPATAFPDTYLKTYSALQHFLKGQPENYSSFNHFEFIRTYIVPLFAQQTALIQHYNLRSTSVVDYALNKQATGLFSKQLYQAQNTKGVFSRVTDARVWNDVRKLGELLFFDPRLSGNGKRSCASCHQPDHAFSEPIAQTMHLNGTTALLRNTPTVLNVQYQHLLMQDGSHISLSDQIKGVIENADEMGGDLKKVVALVKKDKNYKKLLTRLVTFTPQEPEIGAEHVVSALSVYLGSLGLSLSDFDRMMQQEIAVNQEVEAGFNLFMSRSQCATCHFVPQFNGVKPPYVGSEFEVIGIPSLRNKNQMDKDLGRAGVFDAVETRSAFRTSTLRNSAHTAPYMHNGVFNTLDEVIEWYNTGGGVGHGFVVENQTASADSLQLNKRDIALLKRFMESLTEDEVKKRLKNRADEASK